MFSFEAIIAVKRLLCKYTAGRQDFPIRTVRVEIEDHSPCPELVLINMRRSRHGYASTPDSPSTILGQWYLQFLSHHSIRITTFASSYLIEIH